MKRLFLLLLLAPVAWGQEYKAELRVNKLYIEDGIYFDSTEAGGRLLPGTRPRLSRELGGVAIYDKSNNRHRQDTTLSAALDPGILQRIQDSINARLRTAVYDAEKWTYVRLANDFVTSSGSAVDVTGLAFTPAANQRYEIDGRFLLRTATTTVGPRPGVAWPSGMTDGVVTLRTTSSATAFLTANGNINGAVLTAVGGLPTNTQSYPGYLEGMLIAGAAPSGTFRVQLATETAGTNVTMKAGSFIRYRLIP